MEHRDLEEKMRELPHNIISLVHYTALTESGWCDEALERYVVATLWEMHNSINLQQLKKGISDRFPISLKAHELSLILERLEKKGDVIFAKDGCFHLSLSKIQEVKKAVESASFLENKVKANFCGRVAKACPDVNTENVWVSFIEKFLRPLVTTEGARAYDLLTGGKKNIPSLQYVDNFIDVFPKQKEVIRELLFEFLTQDDPDINFYLLTYLDSYFLMSASGLPERVLTEIAGIEKDGLEFVVFVDTNFIYSILNLHDNPSNRAANDLQELIGSTSEKIQIRLFVRKETLDETINSIRFHRDRLSNASYPPNLAEAATKTDISGVIKTFFQRVSESGERITAYDYFLPYETNLVAILASKGIAVFEEGGNVNDYKDFIEIDEDIELQVEYERERHQDSPKSEQKISHDVRFWHFLQNQRNKKNISPFEARFWIVTLDYRFLGFDKFKSAQRGWLPACMHPTQLIQLLRFFIPRSTQLENTLLGVVRFPTLSREFDQKLERICLRIIDILSRHEGIEDIPVPTLTQILADDAIRTRFANNNISESEEIKVIQSSFSRLLDEKESLLREKSIKVNQLVEEMGTVIKEKNQAQNDKAEEITKRESIEKAKSQVDQQLKNAKNELENKDLEINKYRSMLRWVIGIFIFLIGQGVIIFLPRSLSWNWLLNHPHKLGIMICFSLCVLGLSWMIVDKKNRWFALGAMVIGAVIALTQII